MGKDTGIAWCDHTFNPWIGCTKVSQGCENCYAEKQAARFFPDSWGKGAFRRTFKRKHWDEPELWNLSALEAGIRRRVFSGSMCDVFDGEGPEFYRGQLFDLIEETSGLDWLLLTKRPENIVAMLPKAWKEPGTPANVWIGTTVENKARKDRIPYLRKVFSKVRFLSCEPLLEDLGALDLKGIDWVIAGAESGPGARPMDENWVRSIRDQCIEAGVAFFYKQRMESGKKVTLPELDGEVWAQFPGEAPAVAADPKAKECWICHGTGIMSLQPGGILAPCLGCSADKKLSDLMAVQNKEFAAEELEKERQLIREHNERMREIS